MSNTLGELTDKLIVENIKIFRLRSKFDNDKTLTEEEKKKLFHTIELINKQRNDLIKELDEMFEKWTSGEELPRVFKRVKV